MATRLPLSQRSGDDCRFVVLEGPAPLDKHGPIPAVSWPAMTMTFKAKPSALLKGLKGWPDHWIRYDVRGMSAGVTDVDFRRL